MLAQPRYHTLQWVMARKEVFKFLLLDKSLEEGSKDISAIEWNMLMGVVDPNSAETAKFWATALLVSSLSDWGVMVSKQMHACPCQHHETDRDRSLCNLKGRCAILMANGLWQEFISDLQNVRITWECEELLHELPPDTQKSLRDTFAECKNQMIFRSMQAWSFWKTLPYSILAIGYHLISESKADEDNDKTKCRRLLAEYDSSPSKASLGLVTWNFFGRPDIRRVVQDWLEGQKSMGPKLKQMLIGYGTALIVMQRLEGRHHLVQINVSKGRALSPGGVFADLRRARHKDLRMPEFRQQLPALMAGVSDLVPHWTSRRDMLRQIYGYGLEQLHEDVTAEEAIIESKGLQSNQQTLDPRLVTYLRLESD